MLHIAGYTIFSRKYILNLLVVSWFLYFLSSNFTKYWHLTQWTIYITTPHLNFWFSLIQTNLPQAQLFKQDRMMFPPWAHSLQVISWIQSQHTCCSTKEVEGFAEAIQTTCNAAWYSRGKSGNILWIFSKTFTTNTKKSQTWCCYPTLVFAMILKRYRDTLAVIYTRIMCKFLCQRQRL